MSEAFVSFFEKKIQHILWSSSPEPVAATYICEIGRIYNNKIAADSMSFVSGDNIKGEKYGWMEMEADSHDI
ncbi:hypothetical protein T10_5749 [Trichinella papuae]|uniref:Uncharacterized protein n=1 Tax=Trichinella papuae TaxID=268474 RepID=A0A0V1MN31_9BILA|nr:hypothetical protein T10_5749 [Trichinella papuae]